MLRGELLVLTTVLAAGSAAVSPVLGTCSPCTPARPTSIADAYSRVDFACSGTVTEKIVNRPPNDIQYLINKVEVHKCNAYIKAQFYDQRTPQAKPTKRVTVNLHTGFPPNHACAPPNITVGSTYFFTGYARANVNLTITACTFCTKITALEQTDLAKKWNQTVCQ